jgi:hypothetical protein
LRPAALQATAMPVHPPDKQQEKGLKAAKNAVSNPFLLLAS